MTYINEQETPPNREVDRVPIDYALEQLRLQQNLLAGISAGLVAAFASAGIWAVITVATGYQIGWMAVGVGFAVGYGIRTFGNGIDKIFGIAGAALSLLGCAVGNLLAVCGMAAEQESIPFFEVVALLDLSLVPELMVATFSPIDILFYGLAVYEGYQFSFRHLSPQDVEALLPEHL